MERELSVARPFDQNCRQRITIRIAVVLEDSGGLHTQRLPLRSVAIVLRDGGTVHAYDVEDEGLFVGQSLVVGSANGDVVAPDVVESDRQSVRDDLPL